VVVVQEKTHQVLVGWRSVDVQNGAAESFQGHACSSFAFAAAWLDKAMEIDSLLKLNADFVQRGFDVAAAHDAAVNRQPPAVCLTQCNAATRTRMQEAAMQKRHAACREVPSTYQQPRHRAAGVLNCHGNIGLPIGQTLI